ncbi:hypothetical protein SRB5_19400 [Streptomyces sp. RB5]|uniref:SWF or SNF family helicase n=1 Tax=Streptomyces smaragdinus TaxID=2585196 RepID=A0A7K0CED1_9ACTN|nr:SWF or SNF family helicase [Streptomyces smaragdinus]MQY11821.1 hypothetical protein [Streptomyces smaragdinus]
MTELTFAPLPPAGGRGFAVTWWGQAWLRALEDSVLEQWSLARGRKQARAGAVGAVSVRPGRITAMVTGRDRVVQRTDVLLPVLSEDDWERLLDVVADRSGHVAALLDRDMPAQLAEDASAAGVELLPGIGDLQAECGCEEWDHCEHSAALCYQMGRLLDADPFVLLLVRGRGERELLAELQERGTAAARAASTAGSGEEGADADEGVPADAVFAAPRVPLPAPPEPVAHAGTAPVLGAGTAAPAEVDEAALEFLVGATARLARLMLAEALAPGHPGEPSPGMSPDVSADAARLAAGDPPPRVAVRLAAGSGRDRAALARAAAAWRYGGAGALEVLEGGWTPDAAALVRARAQLDEAWAGDEAPALRRSGGRWTVVGGAGQLRLGRDGRWWPYRKGPRGVWEPAGPAEHDPATALAALGEPAAG